MGDSFYLTLPSNSSTKYYPNNTKAQFRTKLPQELRLTGKWEVCLSDIIYPKSIVTPRFSFVIYNTLPGMPRYTRRLYTQKRNFTTCDDFILHLNDLCQLHKDEDKIVFQIDALGMVSLNIAAYCGIIFSKPLMQVLGFRVNSPKTYFNLATVESVTQVLKRRAIAKCQLYDIYTMYIYSDIIEPNIVGDQSARLLDIIPVSNEDHLMAVYRAERPRYVPVQSKAISFPKIEIMTDEGKPVPFDDSGRVVVKLHFKKIYN